MDEIYIVIENLDGEILDVFEEYYTSPELALAECKQAALRMAAEEDRFQSFFGRERDHSHRIEEMESGFRFVSITNGFERSRSFYFIKLNKKKEAK